MNGLKDNLVRLLVMLLLVLPWSSSQALETFETAGVVDRVRHDQLNLSNQKIDYRPTSKMEIQGLRGKKVKYSDLTKGDNVFLKGRVLNNRYFIDMVIYLPDDES